ncbi:MAG: hypothetical protein SGI73_07850 [Chloroflexota bacterium]|nr:hypothetical protein [Chloroflexota bacterium]
MGHRFVQATIRLFMVCAALIALARIGGTAADADILLLNVLNPDADIYLVDAGRALTAALTRGGDFDGHAIWSPDGNAIAFDSNRGADWDIYTMTAFGADVRPVTTGSEPAASFSPVWSPDGTQIAHFQRLQGQSYAALFVTARDGSHTQRLSDYYIMSVQRPTWTADGAQIVFAALHGDGSDIFITDARPPAQAAPPRERTIAAHPAYDSAPAPSPDGRWIAFVSDRETIFTSRLVPHLYDSTTNETRLLNTTPDADINALTWSPDGARLAALEYPRTGLPPRLIAFDPNDGSVTTLLDGRYFVSSPPAWSPDGRWIAVGGFALTPFGISLLVLDTETGAVQAIRAPGPITSAAWRP